MNHSVYQDIRLTGSPKYIEKAWEGRAYEAERSGDYLLAQIYFQQSDHWKKVGRGER